MRAEIQRKNEALGFYLDHRVPRRGVNPLCIPEVLFFLYKGINLLGAVDSFQHVRAEICLNSIGNEFFQNTWCKILERLCVSQMKKWM